MGPMVRIFNDFFRPNSDCNSIYVTVVRLLQAGAQGLQAVLSLLGLKQHIAAWTEQSLCLLSSRNIL